MLTFLHGHKIYSLIGLGTIASGTSITSGVYLSNSNSENVEQTENISEEDAQARPTLAATVITRKPDAFNTIQLDPNKKQANSKALDPSSYINSANLGWKLEDLDVYHKDSVAYQIRKDNTTNVMSRHASSDVWTSMAISALNAHLDTNEKEINTTGYSQEFQSLLMGMKQDLQKQDLQKQDLTRRNWGENLKVVCTTNYIKPYDAKNDSVITLKSIRSFCSLPNEIPDPKRKVPL